MQFGQSLDTSVGKAEKFFGSRGTFCPERLTIAPNHDSPSLTDTEPSRWTRPARPSKSRSFIKEISLVITLPATLYVCQDGL